MEQYMETISCDDICRLCVSQQQSINIFSDFGPKTPKYSEIVKSLADVLVNEKDELPKGICSECSLKLIEFYKFKEQIEESYNELELLLKSANCGNENTEDQKDHRLLNLQINQTEQQKIECIEFQQNIIKEEPESIMDQDEFHNEEGNCTEVENINIYGSNDNIDNDNNNHDVLIYNIYENLNDGVNNDDEYLDNFSTYERDCSESLDNEKASEDDETRKQVLIGGEYSDEQTLWQNKLDMWIKKQKQTNKLKKKPSRIYMCNTCGKGWKSQSELARHNIIHTGRRFECTLCQKKFNQMSHLKGHIDAVHYNKRDFQCTICNMAFSKKYTLTKHMRVHSDQTLYQCQYCPRSFKWQSSLDVHLNSHTGDKPFNCHLCEKSYTSDPALRKHCKRYHNGFGIKPIEQDDIFVEEIV